jgi:hypothetical protein
MFLLCVKSFLLSVAWQRMTVIFLSPRCVHASIRTSSDLTHPVIDKTNHQSKKIEVYMSNERKHMSSLSSVICLKMATQDTHKLSSVLRSIEVIESKLKK